MTIRAVKTLPFIRSEVLAGVPDGQEIGDRGEAIKQAIGDLRKGDTLLIAGKGHETGQIIGDTGDPVQRSGCSALEALTGGG